MRNRTSIRHLFGPMIHRRILLAVVAAWLAAAPAYADGGVVQLRQPAGPFVITVFTAPAPLRAGPVDISVMVQNRDDQQPVLDAQVFIRMGREDGWTVNGAATREQAQNKLLYAALVNLPEPGPWKFQVNVRRGNDSASVVSTVMVAPAQPVLLSYWPFLALPPVLIALFVVHQWLRRRLFVGSRKGMDRAYGAGNKDVIIRVEEGPM